jgi:hypothetical protein
MKCESFIMCKTCISYGRDKKCVQKVVKSTERGHFENQNGEGWALLTWILWKHVVRCMLNGRDSRSCPMTSSITTNVHSACYYQTIS